VQAPHGGQPECIQASVAVNKNWKELIPELDSTGIPINKTVKSLLKLYSKEKVEEAITLRVPYGSHY
jgi:hypothetical protein